MKVAVDLVKCVGHGRCYVLAPDVFEDDDRGHCVLKLERPPPEFEAQARLGAENCPEGAIRIETEAP